MVTENKFLPACLLSVLTFNLNCFFFLRHLFAFSKHCVSPIPSCIFGVNKTDNKATHPFILTRTMLQNRQRNKEAKKILLRGLRGGLG